MNESQDEGQEFDDDEGREFDDDEGQELLKDGETLRVPLLMMDSVQRAIRKHFKDGVTNMIKTNNASFHRPGYRLSVKMTHDQAARDELQDAYDEYEANVTNAHKNAEPVLTPANAVLDEEFDGGEDCYTRYDREIADQWKK